MLPLPQQLIKGKKSFSGFSQDGAKAKNSLPVERLAGKVNWIWAICVDGEVTSELHPNDEV